MQCWSVLVGVQWRMSTEGGRVEDFLTGGKGILVRRPYYIHSINTYTSTCATPCIVFSPSMISTPSTHSAISIPATPHTVYNDSTSSPTHLRTPSAYIFTCTPSTHISACTLSAHRTVHDCTVSQLDHELHHHNPYGKKSIPTQLVHMFFFADSV